VIGNFALKLLTIQTATLLLFLFFLMNGGKSYAEEPSSFTLYITPVLPGIMMSVDAGPPFAYINVNASIPLSRFKITNNNLRRVTIELNARYYIRQFLSVVDEYSFKALYFGGDIGIGNLSYTAATKFVYDRINNLFSVPVGGGLRLRTQLTKCLYFILPLNAYFYSDGYELKSALKLRMVIDAVHTGCNILLGGIFYSKYNFSTKAGYIFFGIGIGGEG